MGMSNNKIERDVGHALIGQFGVALSIIILGEGLIYDGIKPTGSEAAIIGFVIVFIGFIYATFIHCEWKKVKTQHSGESTVNSELEEIEKHLKKIAELLGGNDGK